MATTSNGSDLAPIKRVLRNRDSHQYFDGHGWTDNPEDAKSFADLVEAAGLCGRLGLSNVELAVRINSASCDLFCTSVR